jgi:hypothetical protein
MIQTLKRYVLAGEAWMDRHWGPGRVFLTFVFIGLAIVALSAATLGIMQAHAVSSAGAVIPIDVWEQLLADANELDSALSQAVFVASAAFALGIADAAGRIVYAYLLWVPAPVWTILTTAVFVVLCLGLSANLLWAGKQITGDGHQNSGDSA